MPEFKIMWRLYNDEEVDGEQWDPGYVGTLDECYKWAVSRTVYPVAITPYQDKLHLNVVDEDGEHHAYRCMEPYKVLPAMSMDMAAKWVRRIMVWDVTPTTKRDEIEGLLNDYEKLANSQDLTLNRVEVARLVYAYWREQRAAAAEREEN